MEKGGNRNVGVHVFPGLSKFVACVSSEAVISESTSRAITYKSGSLRNKLNLTKYNVDNCNNISLKLQQPLGYIYLISHMILIPGCGI
jgi:hypothetical protein